MAYSKVRLNGTTLIDLTSDTVAANYLQSGKSAHGADGEAVSGSVAAKSSSDLTVSGATVTVPAGIYSSNASKSVASGTAGTPTATKGTVSNHAVTVTPSVTNTAGYISGGTKTGTGVSVTASELDSGTKEITANGTDIDVVGYASVNVAVSGGGSSKRKVTITGNSSGTANAVRLNGTGSWYYTNGTEIEFDEGDRIIVKVFGSREGGGTIYLDGSNVASAQYGGATYTYYLPDNNVNVDFSYGTVSKAYIVNLPLETATLAENGTYTLAQPVDRICINVGNTNKVIGSQTVAGASWEEYDNLQADGLTAFAEFVLGNKYTVVYDGKIYQCVATESEENDIGVGSSTWVFDDYPFFISAYSSGGSYVAWVAIPTSEGAVNHSFAVYSTT